MGEGGPGEDGRLWPWGTDWDPARANCKPAGPGTTTPVGQNSPGGDSPYGCADMAGNVWEWCSSLNRPYPYRSDDGREGLEGGEGRILRGGSWYDDNPARVRCASRSWKLPWPQVRRRRFSCRQGFSQVAPCPLHPAPCTLLNRRLETCSGETDEIAVGQSAQRLAEVQG